MAERWFTRGYHNLVATGPGTVIRCQRTGNPVGTDTVQAGAEACQCAGCRTLNILLARTAQQSGGPDA